MTIRCRTLFLVTVAVSALAPARALERIETTGEGALRMAAKLIEEGGYGEAEAILRTLAAGDPATLDMRKVDLLAAKIAVERGRMEEAARILTALVEYDPGDWRLRYELAHVLMTDRRDRAAERQLKEILRQAPPREVTARVRQDLKTIDERRVVRLSFRAAAAPSTNINQATDAETFELFGYLPAALDDEARRQSGVGASYALAGALTPTLAPGVQGHVAARGRHLDYEGEGFDQITGGVEAGLRLNAAGKVSGLAAASYEQRYFAGEAYSTSAGGRLALSRPLGRRLRLGGEVAAAKVTYEEQSDRDGPVFSIGINATAILTNRLRFVSSLAATREATQAESLSNSQYSLMAGLDAALPFRLMLGLYPQATYRRFDKAAAVYGERREDVTAEMAASLSVRGLRLRGFVPALSYRYTDNDSTVELFDYQSHSVDMGVSRSF